MSTSVHPVLLRLSCVALLAGLVVAMPVKARIDDFAAASQAYKARDYEKALAQFETAAESGNINAQWMAGLMHRKGRGTEQDPARAFDWLSRAAAAGHAGAQADLAQMLLNGEGVEPDDGEAAYWFAKASDGGDAQARMSLARLYEQGRGVEQDYQQAADLYLESAIQGNTDALYKLGEFAQAGHAAQKSLSDARNWFQNAADRGHAGGLERIGYYRENGLGGFEQDWFGAAQFYQRAAAKGLPAAQYRLGLMYQEGRGVTQNSDIALRWISLAARRPAPGGAPPDAVAVYQQLVSGKSSQQKSELKAYVNKWQPDDNASSAALGPWLTK